MKTIRAKLTLVIVGLALLSSVAIFAVTQWVSEHMAETALTREVQGAGQQLKAMIASESQQALMLASLVAGDAGVQERFAAGDRDGLAREFAGSFADLKKTFGVRQFQFHLPPAISFLRVHKVEKSGDDLSGFRKTVVKTNATAKPVWGLEKGVAGIGNRGVVPVFKGDEHIGSVEFGLGFHDKFVAAFTAQSGYRLAVLRPTDDGYDVIGNTLPETVSPTGLMNELTGEGSRIESGDYQITRLSVGDYSGKPIAVALLAVDRSAYRAIALTAQLTGIALSGLLLAIVGLILYFANRSVLKPLKRVADDIVALAGGARDIEVQGTGRADEIGDMARAADIFRVNAIERERLEAEQGQSQKAREARQERIEQLIATFRASSQDLLSSVEATNRGLQSTAAGLESVAAASAEQASAAAEASGEAAGNVQTVASAAEELSSSISEISNQVVRTTEIVAQANSAAQSSNEKVAGLAHSAQKIGDVVSLIRDIAEQTNLLALNATIEAARAGEAGRGFAVVAAEVKELATQTSRATEEISTQIASIQAATEDTVNAIGAISGTMNEVNGYTSAIAAAVEQQGVATMEISRNIQNAAELTQTVVRNIGSLDEAVHETNQSAASMLTASGDATSKSATFREEIARFLKAVAAA
ncbi:methyl-accepting chemotaxis protein [Breoghania sp.]|uniref:methyl-accepting chemotaxis protein n=1 Tax=Breoghania sp. TaxID=2065378 RepID=UPI002AAB6ED3|nr:methyl-accepting chemotaxis protein [Breoghania sp.]